MAQLGQSSESVLVGEALGERVADSEASLSLESSHGAVGSASLHVVDWKQNPSSVLVLVPSAPCASVTAVTVRRCSLLFFFPRAIGYGSTSSWTFQVMGEPGLCYLSFAHQSPSTGLSMESGFKAKREPSDLRG